MKVITWNVNSVKVRLKRLLDLIDRHDPDVICLQELKCQTEKFPFEEVKAKGYHIEAFGQKTYNGVAILSKHEIEVIDKGNPFYEEDEQRRLIACDINGYTIINVYCPNGSEVGSEKFHYKMEWFEKLSEYIENTFEPDENLIICGDFNIAQKDEDVYDPQKSKGKLLFSDEEKACIQNLTEFGLADCFYLFNQGNGHFSWWDYRTRAFNQNRGFRIDYFLITEPLLDNVTSYFIDVKEREEKEGDKPSDHAPVIISFKE